MTRNCLNSSIKKPEIKRYWELIKNLKFKNLNPFFQILKRNKAKKLKILLQNSIKIVEKLAIIEYNKNNMDKKIMQVNFYYFQAFNKDSAKF